MDTDIQVQILEEAQLFTFHANTLGEGINQFILSPATLLDRLDSLTFVWQPILEKKNFEFKPVKLRLKIDFVSHPDHAEGLGRQIYWTISLKMNNAD